MSTADRWLGLHREVHTLFRCGAPVPLALSDAEIAAYRVMAVEARAHGDVDDSGVPLIACEEYEREREEYVAGVESGDLSVLGPAQRLCLARMVAEGRPLTITVYTPPDDTPIPSAEIEARCTARRLDTRRLARALRPHALALARRLGLRRGAPRGVTGRPVAPRSREHRAAARRDAARAPDDGDAEPPRSSAPPRCWRPLTLAARLSIPPATLYDAIRRGDIEAYRVGRGQVRPRYIIAESAVAEYLARRSAQ